MAFNSSKEGLGSSPLTILLMAPTPSGFACHPFKRRGIVDIGHYYVIAINSTAFVVAVDSIDYNHPAQNYY
jgi:hypothetical protein